ncbi:MAG: hypothetical protein JEY71_06530 [Sphaerochaeta sp.]|nr:hypothetical protein [Sphaerochaeta sp.]
MKGINTPGQALERGGVASFSAPRGSRISPCFPGQTHHADLTIFGTYNLVGDGNSVPILYRVKNRPCKVIFLKSNT